MPNCVYWTVKSENIREIEFLGSSLSDIRAFPEDARSEAGQELLNVQYGGMPSDWKPMSSIGTGVFEIRIKCQSGAFRVIYITKIADAIYVLHAFQKKTQKTNQRDIDLAKKRLAAI